ncbi:hypothetical protein AB833_02700 [Chromatiales bacterium (ex Bugula neritina AB1)]|nr:hypothetical protein AB833_02700 [Chromatiales bacterium (ex Bugula neritina AB1)]
MADAMQTVSDAYLRGRTCDGPARLPTRGGVCLKPGHYEEILQQLPDVGWFEIHAENYLGAGGAPLHYLQQIREHYPLSIHGVGLSIGSEGGLDERHLQRVAKLVERFDPVLLQSESDTALMPI